MEIIMGRIPTRIARNGRRLGNSDPATRRAKSEGYVARSAYKLLEIQQKHRLIPPGGMVLDLGCHPGAWLQVACQSLGPPKKGGMVLGIDLQDTSVPQKYCDDRVVALQADARGLGSDFWQKYCPGGFNVVLSDMCHFTHGNAVADAYKSLELARLAFEIATKAEFCFKSQNLTNPRNLGVLKSGGSLVMKLLQGPGTQEFASELKPHFEKVAWHRPKATRSESKEVFLLGLKRRLIVPSEISE